MQKLILRKARHFAIFSTFMALTAFTTSAQAAAFRTTWDPVFNEDFSALVGVDVGWSGSALITVSDNCVSPGVVAFPAGCGGATLDSYELVFYDVNTNDVLGMGEDMGPGLPAVEAVSFDLMSVADGLDIDGPIDVGAFFFGDYPNSFEAFLDFDELLVPGPAFLAAGMSGPTLILVENCQGMECISFQSDNEMFPPQVVWSDVTADVPAPAPVALLGIGLAALGLMRRKGKA